MAGRIDSLMIIEDPIPDETTSLIHQIRNSNSSLVDKITNVYYRIKNVCNTPLIDTIDKITDVCCTPLMYKVMNVSGIICGCLFSGVGVGMGIYEFIINWKEEVKEEAEGRISYILPVSVACTAIGCCIDIFHGIEICKKSGACEKEGVCRDEEDDILP